MTLSAQTLSEQILDLVGQYFDVAHQTKPFVPGENRVHYAGRVFDADELKMATKAVLDFWLTQGPNARTFERELAAYLGIRHVLLVNSGSSANLLAFAALTSPQLGERRIRRGDEVITVAACFPTTIAPIVQYGAIPVFVDVDLGTLNVDPRQMERALSPKTRAVMIAHSLGNPFDVAAVKTFCEAHDLWLIEDNCDALGSKINGQLTGTFGHIGTSSFYPPHHITMGEGGAVYTNDDELKKILASLRDWGRDCWCESGRDNTCGKRFDFELGSLPKGYDHKYIYSHFGYNLKVTDIQAAIGIAQLKKLPSFVQRRRSNFENIRMKIADLREFLLPIEPTVGAEPSWFGIHLLCQSNAPFTRREIVTYLEDHKIQTRLLFSGNVLRHPCFADLKEGVDFRVVGDLVNTDTVMNDGFWLGVYPGLSLEMMDYISVILHQFVALKCQTGDDQSPRN